MARSRNIKPGFFQNDKLSELEPLARLAFIGMWTIADFKGCIEYRPKMLKVQILPYDDCNMEVISNNLELAGFIRYYSVQGKRYLKIINFEKHQNPHKNEREAGSAIPDISYEEENTVANNRLSKDGTSTDLFGSTPADSLLLIPDSCNSDSLIPDTQIPSVPAAPKKARTAQKSDDEEKLQIACRETWAAYCDAFFNRYGTEPIRNAKVNSCIKNFVKRIGFYESPHVAAHFVNNNSSWYVTKGHAVTTLLEDAEKLRTEWATGNTMTGTRAKQIDKSQANFSVVGEAMKILEGMNNAKTS